MQAFRAGGGDPGDLVACCPDQLGPPVRRLLDGGVEQVAYPTLGELGALRGEPTLLFGQVGTTGQLPHRFG